MSNEDVIGEVCSYLGPVQRVRVKRVSKRFREVRVALKTKEMTVVYDGVNWDIDPFDVDDPVPRRWCAKSKLTFRDDACDRFELRDGDAAFDASTAPRLSSLGVETKMLNIHGPKSARALKHLVSGMTTPAVQLCNWHLAPDETSSDAVKAMESLKKATALCWWNPALDLQTTIQVLATFRSLETLCLGLDRGGDWATISVDALIRLGRSLPHLTDITFAPTASLVAGGNYGRDDDDPAERYFDYTDRVQMLKLQTLCVSAPVLQEVSLLDLNTPPTVPLRGDYQPGADLVARTLVTNPRIQHLGVLPLAQEFWQDLDRSFHRLDAKHAPSQVPLHLEVADVCPYVADLAEAVDCILRHCTGRSAIHLDLGITVSLFDVDDVRIVETDLDTSTIAQVLTKLSGLAPSVVVSIDTDLPSLDAHRLQTILSPVGITVQRL